MNLHAVRRRLRNAGHDADSIEDTIDRLADDDREERKMRELEDQLQRDGYDLEELDRDNPYNQWMYQ